MTQADFLRIAEYANENWAKGSFTDDEVKENAEIYHADYLYSKENEIIAESIKTLCKNLAEDAKESNDIKPKKWLYEIAGELGLIDMDYQDFLETDEWLN